MSHRVISKSYTVKCLVLIVLMIHSSVIDCQSLSSPAVWNSGYVYSSGWLSENTLPRMFADANGDGKVDLVCFGNITVSLLLSSGSSFPSSISWVSAYTVTTNFYTSFDTYPRLIADVNGDGRADLVAFGNLGVYVRLTDSSTNLGSEQTWSSSFDLSSSWNSFSSLPRLMADVNGDGKADIVGFGSSSVQVGLSTGSSFSSPSTWLNTYFTAADSNPSWTSFDAYPRFLADVNGDGMADIVGFAQNGVLVSLSTGSAFSAPTTWLSNNFGNTQMSSFSTTPKFVGDVNGDGLADLIAINSDLFISISNGSGFETPVTYQTSFLTNTYDTFDSYPIFAADVDGDGQVEIITFFNNVSVYKINNCAGMCLICPNTETYCTLCRSGYIPVQGSMDCEVSCPSGYVLASYTTANYAQIYLPCTSPCSTCSGSQTTCTSCINSYLMVYNENRCVTQCETGYYLDISSNECKLCTSPCSQCDTSPTTCTSCVSNYYLVQNQNTCVSICPPGYFLDPTNVCEQCVSNCDVCSDGTSCKTCSANYFLNSNTGLCGSTCNTGYWKNTSSRTCDSCLASCNSCSDGTTCDTCKTNYYYMNQSSQCMNPCGDGYYGNSSVTPWTCDSCMTSCATCTDGSTCKTCPIGAFLNSSSQCQSYCSQGYWHNATTGQCEPCKTNCASCTDGSTCEKCSSGYFYSVSNDCVNQCGQGYWPNTQTQICDPCLNTCETCTDNSTCQTCTSALFLDPVNSLCSSTCNSGYWGNSATGKCENCVSNCSSCVDGMTCQNCYSPYFLDLSTNLCVSSCPSGFYGYKSINACTTCDLFCSDCPDYIAKCPPPASYYLDTSTTVLKYLPCYTTCEKCTEAGDATNNNCQSCKSGYTPSPNNLSQCIIVVSCPGDNGVVDKMVINNISPLSFKDSQKISVNVTLSEIVNNGNPLTQIASSYITSNTNQVTILNEETYECYDVLLSSSSPVSAGKYQLSIVDGDGNKITSSDTIVVTSNDYPLTIQPGNTQVFATNMGIYIKNLFLNGNVALNNVYVTNSSFVQISNSTAASQSIANQQAEDNRLSMVDTGDCANILKQYYHIPQDQNLIYVKLDNVQGSSSANQVKFLVYDQEGDQLDISKCNQTITYNIPINTATSGLNLTEGEEFSKQGIDIYNPNSPFYNDICFSYHNNKTDITVDDRRTKIYPNISISCGTGCTYSGIDYTTNYTNCQCNSTNQGDVVSTFLHDSLQQLLQSNLKVLTCFKEVMIMKALLKNYGFYFTLATLFMMIVSPILVAMFYNPMKTEFLWDIIHFDCSRFAYSDTVTFNSLDTQEPGANPPKKFKELEESEDSAGGEADNKKLRSAARIALPMVNENTFNSEDEYSPSSRKSKIVNNYIPDVKPNHPDTPMESSFSLEEIEQAKNVIITPKINVNNSPLPRKVDSTPFTHSKFYLGQLNKKPTDESQSDQNESDNEVKKRSPVKIVSSSNVLKSNKNLITMDSQNYISERKEEEEKEANMKRVYAFQINHTFTDFENMKFEQILEYDKRTFCQYYWESLVKDHSILSVVYYKSLKIPLHMRVYDCLFSILVDFGCNAAFYSDSYISAQSTTTQNLNFFYTFLYQFPRNFYSMLMGCILMAIVQKFLEPTGKVEEELNECLLTGNLEIIREK